MGAGAAGRRRPSTKAEVQGHLLPGQCRRARTPESPFRQPREFPVAEFHDAFVLTDRGRLAQLTEKLSRFDKPAPVTQKGKCRLRQLGCHPPVGSRQPLECGRHFGKGNFTQLRASGPFHEPAVQHLRVPVALRLEIAVGIRRLKRP